MLRTGSDLEIMTMKKAYDDSETCKNFTCRAWVKLVHPFNPIEFIRSLLPQFYRNSCSKQEETANFLEVLAVATDKELILDFKNQISQRYLVVLEDVSTMVDWEVVRGYLPDKNNGSAASSCTRDSMELHARASGIHTEYQSWKIYRPIILSVSFSKRYEVGVRLNHDKYFFFMKRFTPSFIIF